MRQNRGTRQVSNNSRLIPQCEGLCHDRFWMVLTHPLCNGCNTSDYNTSETHFGSWPALIGFDFSWSTKQTNVFQQKSIYLLVKFHLGQPCQGHLWMGCDYVIFLGSFMILTCQQSYCHLKWWTSNKNIKWRSLVRHAIHCWAPWPSATVQTSCWALLRLSILSRDLSPLAPWWLHPLHPCAGLSF